VEGEHSDRADAGHHPGDQVQATRQLAIRWDEPPMAVGVVERERQRRRLGPGGRAERDPKGEARQEAGGASRQERRWRRRGLQPCFEICKSEAERGLALSG